MKKFTSLLQFGLLAPVLDGQLLVLGEQLVVELGPDAGAILQG